MNVDERFAEMALAIQQLTQRVIKPVQNEERLTNLKPPSPCKTMTTPTKLNKTSYVPNERDCHEGVQIFFKRGSRRLIIKKTSKDQTQLQAKAIKTIEDKEPIPQLIHTHDEEIQNEKETAHLPIKEISENQVQQKTKTLKTAEDETVDVELIQPMNIDDIEIN